MISIKKLEGRPTFVCPVVMLQCGIFNGSGGACYYPADELKRTASLWNSRVVVAFHPTMTTDGYAGNPDVFNRQKIGTIFNSRFDGKRLLAEAWIDVERVAEVDYRIKRAIDNREKMEVSTGLLLDPGPQGVFNGKAYKMTANNIRPDHLAILPTEVGACSIKDGCGLVRNESDGGRGGLQLPELSQLY